MNRPTAFERWAFMDRLDTNIDVARRLSGARGSIPLTAEAVMLFADMWQFYLPSELTLRCEHIQTNPFAAMVVVPELFEGWCTEPFCRYQMGRELRGPRISEVRQQRDHCSSCFAGLGYYRVNRMRLRCLAQYGDFNLCDSCATTLGGGA